MESFSAPGWGRVVGAAEHAAHAGGQVLSDPVATQPGAGARSSGGALVRWVRFRADHDDALRSEGREQLAAPAKVSVIEHDEIRTGCGHDCGQVASIRGGL